MLKRYPATLNERLAIAMLEAGIDDGMISEVNQVVSYFAYANRTVLGLGVSTDGGVLGLSPGNNDYPGNWSHG